MRMLELESDHEYIVTRVRRVWRSAKAVTDVQEHVNSFIADMPISSGDSVVLNVQPEYKSHLYSESATNLLPNCSYLYDYDKNSETHTVDMLSLYLDGPLTLFFAVLALLGGRLAVKFLGRARLNKDLTSALYILCFCDSFLIIMVVIYHSIEATGLLLTHENPMWDHQAVVVLTHGLVSALTTSSTLLVVHISFQRFLVVYWPLKYSKMHSQHRRQDTYRNSTFRKISQNDADSVASTVKRCNSSVTKPTTICQQKNLLSLRNFRSFIFPVFVILFGFFLNITVFFEFELKPCYAFQHNAVSSQFFPTGLRQNQTYNSLRTVIMLLSQTIGPILVISFLTIVTEFRVHSSLKARRQLFESQQRRRSLVQLEEMKEKLSRFVAIFIATKFIILRSLPVLLDVYEVVHGIDFSTTMSMLVRISDFFVVLNTATNTLAYFGRAGWLEKKLRRRLRSKTSNAESPSVAQSKKSILLTSDQTSVTGQLMSNKL